MGQLWQAYIEAADQYHAFTRRFVDLQAWVIRREHREQSQQEAP